MKFTDTKKKAEEQKKKYIESAPLTEKKQKFTNVSVTLNETERSMVDSYLESQQNETGRKMSRSSFIRNAVIKAVRNSDNEEQETWNDEPFTIAEAAEKYGVNDGTIKSALKDGRFTKFEAKKLAVKGYEVWVITRRGMERLFNQRVR